MSTVIEPAFLTLRAADSGALMLHGLPGITGLLATGQKFKLVIDAGRPTLDLDNGAGAILEFVPQGGTIIDGGKHELSLYPTGILIDDGANMTFVAASGPQTELKERPVSC
jgi:hypothetical protein